MLGFEGVVDRFHLLPVVVVLALLGASVQAQSDDLVVTYDRSDFQESGERLTALHRGVNFYILGQELQWDSSVAAEADFYTVAQDPAFIGLVKGLDIGTVRIPGGTQSNYHDALLPTSQTWVDWAIDSEDTFNATADWNEWWTFYNRIGRPVLMSTGNVFTDGNPDPDGDPSTFDGTWIDMARNEAWVDYASTYEGITGAYWEAGNEVYITDSVPGMDYLTYGTHDSDSYPARAVEFSSYVHAADPTSKVGLVVYEHGTTAGYFHPSQLLSDVSLYGSPSDFDFFIVHDYAPLHPYDDGKGSYTFRQAGVEKSLAYQDLVDTIGDLRTVVGDAEIHVTEYGLLFNTSSNWVSEWDDKGVALLMAHHFMELVAEGADGLWFWEALSKWYQLIDPSVSPPVPTQLYFLMQKLFALRGDVLEGEVRGTPTASVSGPIGSGGWETDSDSDFWHLVRSSSDPAVDVDLVRSFGVYDGLAGTMNVLLMNFDKTDQRANVGLGGFGLTPGPITFDRWTMHAPGGWDGSLAGPTGSKRTRFAVTRGGRIALEGVRVPARSFVVLQIPVP